MPFRRRAIEAAIAGLIVTPWVMSCRPSDILSVPTPAGVISNSELQSLSGAESVFDQARAQLFTSQSAAIEAGGMLTDEFSFSGFTVVASDASVDARRTVGGGGFSEYGDQSWLALLTARGSLVIALTGLRTYEPPAGRPTIGEAEALKGYAELLIAESFCAGTPLDEPIPGGGIRYGSPLTTDSLFGTAVADLDSALAAAQVSPTVAGLAGVGLGRALLDRGLYAAAGAAVAGIPISFVYNAELEPNYSSGASEGPNLYADAVEQSFDRIFNVADSEGVNGLNFVSAQDPRLVLDTASYQTADGNAAWRLPIKFEANPSLIPLATGVEATLIKAEADLHSESSWLADLNALRAAAPSTYLALSSPMDSLPDPGTDSGRVSLMFRERAFWLFGTGTRLGDLRRLIRQYGRDQSVVFPTGPYANGTNANLPSPIPSYGTDVNLTLPTAYGLAVGGTPNTNPNYKGCTTSTKAA